MKHRFTVQELIFSLAVMLIAPAFAQPGAAVPMTGGEVTPPMLKQIPPSTAAHFEGPDVISPLPVAPVPSRAGKAPDNCACARRSARNTTGPDVLVSPPPATPAGCVC